MTVKVGEKVLVPEYGGTKVNFEEKVRVCNKSEYVINPLIMLQCCSITSIHMLLY